MKKVHAPAQGNLCACERCNAVSQLGMAASRHFSAMQAAAWHPRKLSAVIERIETEKTLLDARAKAEELGVELDPLDFVPKGDTTWKAGAWEQSKGFVAWSKHLSEKLAQKAAVKYARQQKAKAGGALSWCGGVMAPDGTVTWYQRDGAVAETSRI